MPLPRLPRYALLNGPDQVTDCQTLAGLAKAILSWAGERDPKLTESRLVMVDDGQSLDREAIALAVPLPNAQGFDRRLALLPETEADLAKALKLQRTRLL